jgi:hypothetical protein
MLLVYAKVFKDAGYFSKILKNQYKAGMIILGSQVHYHLKTAYGSLKKVKFS